MLFSYPVDRVYLTIYFTVPPSTGFFSVVVRAFLRCVQFFEMRSRRAMLFNWAADH